MTTVENGSKLPQALYLGHSIPDVLSEYEQILRKEGEIAHATKIAEYRSLIINKEFLSKIRKNFNNIYKLIDKDFSSEKFCIDGRRKSLISTDKKIQLLLDKNRSLDLLRDMFAFRITLLDRNSETLINTCYDIANRVIEYFIGKGLTLCEADIKKDIRNFNSEEHPSLFIPKKSGIKKKFRYGVKDYILHPKVNGYQSLHITFRTSIGACFEVQIRTFDMHVHAESGYACHAQYKEEKYCTSSISYNPNKINIPGYGVSPDGKIFDFIGLQEPLEIVKRSKTY